MGQDETRRAKEGRNERPVVVGARVRVCMYECVCACVLSRSGRLRWFPLQNGCVKMGLGWKKYYLGRSAGMDPGSWPWELGPVRNWLGSNGRRYLVLPGVEKYYECSCLLVHRTRRCIERGRSRYE
jgi:hypothetical protein